MRPSRAMIIEHDYLNLPVQRGAAKRRMRLFVEGVPVGAFDIELSSAEPDFWAYCDISAFKGQNLLVEVDGLEMASGAWERIAQSDAPTGAEDLYRERYRPQFHFSSRRGWNNDPNGLLYAAGEYHLFYQHNPYGTQWGNMHWGHAISSDLVHWRELGEALYPDALGTVFSGSGVVDGANTAGLQRGGQQTLVCVYTAAGGTSPESEGRPFTQCLAYSHDLGRTWRKHAQNPVLGHLAGHNRDPKVIWHEATRQWIMALYLDGHDYALLSSPDLKCWARLGEVTLPGCSECPDFFPLPVDGDLANVCWVFWGANGTYLLGTFDGTTFQPQSEALHFGGGSDSYAAQTWSDIPAEDGRRIQIAWLRVELPGMPFNQCMTFPCELTLRTMAEGIRLCGEPVREIAVLYTEEHAWRDVTLAPGENPLSGLRGELFDIRAELQVGEADAVGLTLRGTALVYDVRKRQITCAGRSAEMEPIAGQVSLRVLVDRASLEIFGNDGRVVLALGVLAAEGDRSLEVFSRGGIARLRRLTVHTLRPAWR